MAYGQNLHLKFSREIVHRRMTYIAIVSNAVWKKLRITIRIMKRYLSYNKHGQYINGPMKLMALGNIGCFWQCVLLIILYIVPKWS